LPGGVSGPPHKIAIFCHGDSVLVAQTAGRPSRRRQKPAAAGAATAPKVEANLLQLMRGIVYPASNVISSPRRRTSASSRCPQTHPRPPNSVDDDLWWLAGGRETPAWRLPNRRTLIAMPGAHVFERQARTGAAGRLDQGCAEAFGRPGGPPTRPAKKKGCRRDGRRGAARFLTPARPATTCIARKKGGEKDRCLP